MTNAITAIEGFETFMPGYWGNSYPPGRSLNCEQRDMKGCNLKGNPLLLMCNSLGMQP